MTRSAGTDGFGRPITHAEVGRHRRRYHRDQVWLYKDLWREGRLTKTDLSWKIAYYRKEHSGSIRVSVEAGDWP